MAKHKEASVAFRSWNLMCWLSITHLPRWEVSGTLPSPPLALDPQGHGMSVRVVCELPEMVMWVWVRPRRGEGGPGQGWLGNPADPANWRPSLWGWVKSGLNGILLEFQMGVQSGHVWLDKYYALREFLIRRQHILFLPQVTFTLNVMTRYLGFKVPFLSDAAICCTVLASSWLQPHHS